MIAVRVQHHPSRRHLIPGLLANLGSLPVQLIADPEPEAKRPIAWRTYRECLLSADAGSDWTLVLQDDVEVCADFPEALTEALVGAEGCLVALFISRQAVHTRKLFWEAQKAGEPWCGWSPKEGWVNAVALCWPTQLIPTFLAWADSRGYTSTRDRADDAIIGEWCKQSRTQVRATVPCLVEHPDREPSISNDRRGHTRNPRLALAFAGAEPRTA